MLKRHRHLSDDRLIELCLEGADARVPDGCSVCEQRHAELVTLLAEVDAAVIREADTAFSDERLARQRARILQRLGQDGRPGRVIAFPGHLHDAPVIRPRTGTRWIAAAAAAGLLIGLIAGHMTRDLQAPITHRATGAPLATDAGQPALRAVATTLSEDEFLGEVEMAADSPGATELRSLHDLTPRAWEVK